MPRSTGGDKRSSWLTFHRRLFLVRRLVCGPADAPTLIEDARAFFSDPDIYPPDARAALRHDFQALRGEFECVIRLREDGCYALEEFGRLALLDLPEADLEALTFLLANFSESPLPNAAQVDALLDRIVALLPSDRRQRFTRQARDVRLDYPRPSNSCSDRTLTLLKRALRRQQVGFAYRSSYAQGDAVVEHVVAPYDLIFRDGHTYLEAFCHDCGLPELTNQYVLYRLDRIVADSVRLMPAQLPPLPPARPSYHIRYQLAASVARQRDIALWFPHSAVVFEADGSAQVTAQITDLWQARQILLRYREHCRVLEPPILVEMMRASIEQMLQVYETDVSDALTAI